MAGLDVQAWLARLRELRSREAFRFPAEAVPSDFRNAAVLILFWEDAGTLRTLLTRRPAHMSRHAGQIAFPGGILEEGESYRDAAVREAHEEVGLDPSSIEVVGRLDDAWSGAGNRLAPFVALSKVRPRLSANPAEVADILTPDVAPLLRPEARGQEMVEWRGIEYANETVEFEGGKAYGLSADLLLEALEWGGGHAPRRGEARLRDLASYHRLA